MKNYVTKTKLNDTGAVLRRKSDKSIVYVANLQKSLYTLHCVKVHFNGTALAEILVLLNELILM